MFCTQCGLELQPQDRYCSQCGTRTGVPSAQSWPASRPLTLSTRDKKIGGVCAGLAHYLNVDVTLVRIVWLVLTFVPPGAGLIAYVLAWLIMPHEQPAAVASQPSMASQ